MISVTERNTISLHTWALTNTKFGTASIRTKTKFCSTYEYLPCINSIKFERWNIRTEGRAPSANNRQKETEDVVIIFPSRTNCKSLQAAHKLLKISNLKMSHNIRIVARRQDTACLQVNISRRAFFCPLEYVFKHAASPRVTFRCGPLLTQN